MKETEICLLIQREEDGLFLYLDEQTHTTTPHYVEDPAKAKRIKPWEGVTKETINRPPSYYLENSDRMKKWTAGCKLVAYEVETTVVTKPLLDLGEGPIMEFPVSLTNLQSICQMPIEDDESETLTEACQRADRGQMKLSATIMVEGLQEFLKLHKVEDLFQFDVFRVPTPEVGSEDLKFLFDFAFDKLHASIAGRMGHMPYGEENTVAPNQDGHIYFYKVDNKYFRLTANSELGVWKSGEVTTLSVDRLRDMS